MAYTISFQDLTRLHKSIRQELTVAFDDVLRQSAFVQGPFVSKFERAFARYTGATDCLGVGNGTDALEIILESLGTKSGDRVLVPSLTFTATAEAVVRCGGVPVFVDVDPLTQCATLEDYQRAINATSEPIKAAILVHLHGRAIDPRPLLKLKQRVESEPILLIEDCAQAHGARIDGRHVGTFGVAGAFSFYPGKNLGALGDAGAIITNSPDVAQSARLLRDHGRAQKYYHDFIGRNSRMDGLQAAFLSVKLKYLDIWTSKRREIAEMYFELLEGIDGLKLPQRPTQIEGHVFHNFVIRVVAVDKSRDGLKAWLADQKIETGIHYPLGLHAQPAYANYRSYSRHLLVNTELCVGQVLSLPIDPLMAREEVERVCAEVRRFMESS